MENLSNGNKEYVSYLFYNFPAFIYLNIIIFLGWNEIEWLLIQNYKIYWARPNEFGLLGVAKWIISV